MSPAAARRRPLAIARATFLRPRATFARYAGVLCVVLWRAIGTRAHVASLDHLFKVEETTSLALFSPILPPPFIVLVVARTSFTALTLPPLATSASTTA